MKTTSRFAVAVAAVAGATGLIASAPAATATQSPEAKPTIVLVHGAWADGSSWAGVTERLQHQGYTVDVPPNTLRGLATDSANLHAFLQTVKGPIVLVGHSYGGEVITNAAVGIDNVKSLVYVDAFIPDNGETAGQLSAAKPGSALAVEDPSTVFNTVTIPNGGGNVDLYVKPGLFPQIFAGGVDHDKAAVLAAGQRPLAGSALSDPSGEPAWKTLPSWALIGTADKVIPPAEQQVMADRAGSHIVKVNAPHLSMVARPGAVTDLIAAAATHS
ncbi:alpha/beta fold hydrolase [Streptomyces sp. NPDC059224]|uniref:alpha/beta fold hydrolase n=1 Tax=Streptomyces sp. NPDC059224 TaxID=3346775 RepID=UPI0036A0E824